MLLPRVDATGYRLAWKQEVATERGHEGEAQVWAVDSEGILVCSA